MRGFILKLKKLEERQTKKTLEDGASNDRLSQIFSVEQAQAKEIETLLGTFTEEIGSQQDQNFSQDYNDVPKNNNRKRKERSNYSNTKVKGRNLLTNVSYRRFKQSDFLNNSFVIDLLSFMVQNFAPINLGRKLDDEREKCMVKFVWDECIPHDFTRFVYEQDNFSVISNPKLTYQKANNVVKEFIKEDPNRINILKYKIEKNFNLIHYVYSLLFPKIYNRVNHFGIQNKSSFDFVFSNLRVKKQNDAVAPKIVNELPTPTKQLLITNVLAKPKNQED